MKCIGINPKGTTGAYLAIVVADSARWEDDGRRVALYYRENFVGHIWLDQIEPDDDLDTLLEGQVRPGKPLHACGDQGIQVTEQQLAKLGPVGASIEAADVMQGPDAPLPMEDIRRQEGM